jgi:ferredoxin-fold anticodon binding domain-containing protein
MNQSVRDINAVLDDDVDEHILENYIDDDDDIINPFNKFLNRMII